MNNSSSGKRALYMTTHFRIVSATRHAIKNSNM